MIGTTVSHYRIIEKLGEGGMGVVYKAQDLRLDRLVALKFLSSHLTANESEKKRFVHEAKAASALDHPNICTFYELGETDQGQIFIAMAYYEGYTLKDKIKDRPLPLDEAIDAAIAVAQGLSKAHEKGITHRDVKPENVIVTHGSGVKIMDFGLASIIGTSTITKAGATVGTVPYMSPEQARGGKVDSRTDIWSLGAVLYEMITGQLPFKSQYDEAIVYSILNENPQPITALRTGVPMELERIVSKCLQKSPADRYQHADELLVDLRQQREQLEHAKTDYLLSSHVSAPGEISPSKKRLLKYVAAFAGVLGSTLVIFLYLSEPFRSGPEKEKSIAVLPFVNLSSDKEDEYFSDGITEDLITQLSKIGELKVISRTSIMRYKNSDKTLRAIGDELGVVTILEGSVQHSGDRVRIVSQLIDARTDKHLWAETYDRDAKDVLEIQSEVAQKIAATLEAKLSSPEKKRLTAPASSNIEVYNLLLQGRYFFARRGKENYAKAVDLYKQALTIDPSDARIWAALADAYANEVYLGYVTLSFEEGFAKARQAAEKAISLDDQLADGHRVMGNIEMIYDWDWARAEAEFQKALVLEPGNSNIIRSMSSLAGTLGRFDEAIRLARKSIDLDPATVRNRSVLALMLSFTNRLEEAVRVLKKAIELNPPQPFIHGLLGAVFLLQGEADSAFAEIQKEPEEFWRLVFLALAYDGPGRKIEADAALMDLKAKYQNSGPVQIAWIYAYRGDSDNAFKWFEYAYIQRDPGLIQIKGNPFLKKIENDPRFTALLKRIGLEK